MPLGVDLLADPAFGFRAMVPAGPGSSFARKAFERIFEAIRDDDDNQGLNDLNGAGASVRSYYCTYGRFDHVPDTDYVSCESDDQHRLTLVRSTEAQNEPIFAMGATTREFAVMMIMKFS